MIEKFKFDGEGFAAIMQFENWRIGFLRYAERFSKFDCFEKHHETDEAFVLLEGKATLYTQDEKNDMEKCVVYNIPKGEWHHITVSEDATVMVVENSDTNSENTMRRML